jgi:hypothetical protein
LSEGHAIRHATADVANSMLSRRRVHLLMQQRQEIARIEAISNLSAATVKPNVFQRAMAKPCVDPKAKDPLIRPTKLTSAGQ